MKAYQIADYGRQPVLVEIATPTAGPGDVLVRIMACGINFADLLMLKGKYQERPSPPVTLGMELSGVVEQLGPEVTKFHVGQRVAVYSGHGGLAQFGVFAQERCVALPDDIPFDHAAGLLIAYGTSHLALCRRARLLCAETLLVLGASGGVGLTAVEIGAALGAQVIACARGDAKLAVAQAAGADHLIDSDDPDLREKIKALGGADVVFDPIGGDLFRTALRCTNPEGRILTIGFASGDIPQIPANHLLVKNIDVLGLNFGGYLRFNPAVLGESIAEIFTWYQTRKIKPHISHRFPLDKAADALETLRARKSTGKVIVEIGS